MRRWLEVILRTTVVIVVFIDVIVDVAPVFIHVIHVIDSDIVTNAVVLLMWFCIFFHMNVIDVVIAIL